MGREIETSEFSKADFAEFRDKLRVETALLASWLREGGLADGERLCGFELEAWVVDAAARPAPRNAELIEAAASELVVPELASFNVEINGNPQRLQGGGLRVLQRELEATWQRCCQAAHRLDLRLAMIGILPTAEQMQFGLEHMSSMVRYEALNKQIMRLRRGRPIRLEIKGREQLVAEHTDLMVEAAATSFQIHLQVDARESARIYNAARIVSAPMVAVGANSPFLFGRSLWEETRIPLFEQAVAVDGRGCPPRVMFGNRYARDSLAECFADNLNRYPTLLPIKLSSDPARLEHLRLHNGTIWRWNRPLIGFDAAQRPHLRIEHRVVPAGPTIIDSVANAALFYGLVWKLAREPKPPEQRLSYARARENFYRAARDGLTAQIHWLDDRRASVAELLQNELLALARRGLEALELDRSDIDDYLGVIAARVGSGRTGAAWQREYADRHGRNWDALVNAYLDLQNKGLPVHEWPTT